MINSSLTNSYKPIEDLTICSTYLHSIYIMACDNGFVELKNAVLKCIQLIDEYERKLYYEN